MKRLLVVLFLAVGVAAGLYFWCSRVQVEQLVIYHDQDEDGIYDLKDIVLGARREVTDKTTYRDGYYEGGYPPEGEGVCTDLVWRAFSNAGYDLKKEIDLDIQEHPEEYPVEKPDPNIDFRRIVNLRIFFARHGTVLTNEIIPGDPENLAQWQGGDIVITDDPEHIGIVSDKRNASGVPYVIHNPGPCPRESNTLRFWKVTAHFRYPKEGER